MCSCMNGEEGHAHQYVIFGSLGVYLTVTLALPSLDPFKFLAWVNVTITWVIPWNLDPGWKWYTTESLKYENDKTHCLHCINDWTSHTNSDRCICTLQLKSVKIVYDYGVLWNSVSVVCCMSDMFISDVDIHGLVANNKW